MASISRWQREYGVPPVMRPVTLVAHDEQVIFPAFSSLRASRLPITAAAFVIAQLRCLAAVCRHAGVDSARPVLRRR